MRILLAAAAAAAATGTPHGPSPVAVIAAPPVRLPGFAAMLADRPIVDGPGAWQRTSGDAAWKAVTSAPATRRQEARWGLAGALIAEGHGPEAIGVLEVMAEDDPDLTLVAAFQRARGVALALAGKYDAALEPLADPMLLHDPESCLWRMRARAAAADARPALAEIRCARSALAARRADDRRPFVLAGARAALAGGKAQAAFDWLRAIPDGDPHANLLRGEALLALGRMQEARLRLDRVRLAGSAEDAAEARLRLIEDGIARRTMGPTKAVEALDDLLFTARGGAVERRALALQMQIAETRHDDLRLLQAGATLFRYFGNGADALVLLARLQGVLAAMLSPGSRVPLDRAAGMFWDYRDLAPGGAEGLRLVELLVGRLQSAGLYDRAGDLLQHRLNASDDGAERGALAVRVASLRILAGDPAAAIRALRATGAYPFSGEMLVERRRVEAAALTLAGRTSEALAAIDGLPDAGAVRGEIYWRAHDWTRLAATGEPALPRPGRLNLVEQVIVLRHAIALAMLGRDRTLASLHARYVSGFAGQPTGAAFAMLTGDPAAVSPARLTEAMAALPSVSPAEAFADLVERGADAKAAATSGS